MRAQVLKHNVIGHAVRAAAYFREGKAKAEGIVPVMHISPYLAQRLQLSGPPDEDALVALLSGFAPGYTEQLRMRLGAGMRRGNEFTLTAGKTVSIAACLLPRDVAGVVRAAHREAADTAIGLLRANFSNSAPKNAPGAWHLTPHSMTLDFVHSLNRHDEPHLHSHLVTPNIAWSEELGRFTDCNIRFAIRQVTPIDRVYNLTLAAALLRRQISAQIDPRGYCQIPELEPLSLQYSTPFRRIMERVREIEAKEGRAVGWMERAAIWMEMRPGKRTGRPERFGELAEYAERIRTRKEPPPQDDGPKRDELEHLAGLPVSQVVAALLERYRVAQYDIAAKAEEVALIRRGKAAAASVRLAAPAKAAPVSRKESRRLALPGELLPRRIKAGSRVILVNNPKLRATPPDKAARKLAKQKAARAASVSNTLRRMRSLGKRRNALDTQ